MSPQRLSQKLLGALDIRGSPPVPTGIKLKRAHMCDAVAKNFQSQAGSGSTCFPCFGSAPTQDPTPSTVT